MRAADAQTRIDHAAGIAALCQSLVALLVDRHDANDVLPVHDTHADRREPLARGARRARRRAGRSRHRRADADARAAPRAVGELEPYAVSLGCERELAHAADARRRERRRAAARDRRRRRRRPAWPAGSPTRPRCRPSPTDRLGFTRSPGAGARRRRKDSMTSAPRIVAAPRSSRSSRRAPAGARPLGCEPHELQRARRRLDRMERRAVAGSRRADALHAPAPQRRHYARTSDRRARLEARRRSSSSRTAGSSRACAFARGRVLREGDDPARATVRRVDPDS